MVIHHTASAITANARGRSAVLTLESRSVVSLIAVMDHASALAPAAGSPMCSRFHAARQRAEQNRACSRRGTNEVPHCSQSRISATTLVLHIEGLCGIARPVPAAWERSDHRRAGGACLVLNHRLTLTGPGKRPVPARCP